MKVLVTGGAGYIGSHTVRELINSGHRVTVIDDLSKGHALAVDPRATLFRGSTGDSALLRRCLDAEQIEAVLHFAANIEVSESVLDPVRYYRNNFANTLSLLGAMVSAGVKRFVFSSTAAVYGNPVETPIDELHPSQPISPYGRSKMMAELAIKDVCHAHGLSATILRYFNVAGAGPDGSIGEDHHPESHLIPRILRAARDVTDIQIFGTDYDTPDGTCIRDYVHVVDLAHAHVLALEKLKEGSCQVLNIGSETGFSVREVITACEQVVGTKLGVIEGHRRDGDPAILVASSRRIREDLGWRARYPEIRTIVQHAWHWHSTHPLGFRGKINPSVEAHSSTLEI